MFKKMDKNTCELPFLFYCCIQASVPTPEDIEYHLMCACYIENGTFSQEKGQL